MPSPLLMRSDISDVEHTFSSWDSCMTKAYCKWPAIVGIIIGCLIVISILWCCVRCLCCGASCCCGCLSCFNACCPSGRKNDGYEKQPPPQPYGYQSPMPPVYGAASPMYGGAAHMYGGAGPAWGGYNAPQTASYDVNNRQAGIAYNEDALPAMPGWDTAQNKRQLVQDDVEMNRMDQHTAQTQPFLASGALQPEHSGNQRYYNQDAPPAGDMGTMQTSPYHNYGQHQQSISPVSSMGQPAVYPPAYNPHSSPQSPQSTLYEPNYAHSIPPSYRTTPASPMAGIGRKPVQGSFRNV